MTSIGSRAVQVNCSIHIILTIREPTEGPPFNRSAQELVSVPIPILLYL